MFEYRQAEEVRDAFARHQVRYLFLGKSGAILAVVRALLDLGFQLTEEEQKQVRRGKDFIQLKNGPFDLDLIYAPDGIERFSDAWARRVEVEGFMVCRIDDIIASKRAANRQKDRESLQRLEDFRTYLRSKGGAT